MPIAARADAVIVSGRVRLADMFALTTLFAVYLAAWYPIFEIALDDERMFGARFLFTIMLVALGVCAAIGLAVVLVPLIATMLDDRGPLFQIVVHSIVILIVCSSISILSRKQVFGAEEVSVCVGTVVALFAYQTLLYFIMGRPRKWFRFRLVRLKTREAGAG